MKESLSSVDIAAIVAELQELIRARVEKAINHVLRVKSLLSWVVPDVVSVIYR